MYQELIHEEKIDGFDICFYACEEHAHPCEVFDDSVDDIADICDKIERGIYSYFCAKVTASKNGIELASDYLGCCLYDSCQQFVKDDGYYFDMKQSVINQAKSAIQLLA